MPSNSDSDPTLSRQLEALQRQQDLILDSVGEGIYGLDCQGMTTFVNPAAEKILGWNRGELLHKPQHDLIHHTKRDGSHYDRLECPIYQAFKDGAIHRVDHEVFWRKDGTSLDVEYVSTPIRDEAGNLKGAVVTFRDISERRRRGAELARAHREVEHLKDRLAAENTYLQQEIRLSNNFGEIVGDSLALTMTKRRIEQVATTDATVLMLGETGVGKELFARAIHELSPRSNRPLVKVNCAALSATLIESELFGHERGAFTGSTGQRAGRFELADGGTLFLDEIGELPLELQPKLLRALQEGEFERLGGSRTLKVNIRVIAATNRDLLAEVQQGNFRSDLYYRLGVFPIDIPALKDRKEDIPQLVAHFVRKYAKKFRRTIDRVPDEVQRALEDYDWPGNVRELQNVIERAMILSTAGTLQIDDTLLPSRAQAPASAASAGPDRRTLDAVERAHIVSVLESTGWRIEGPKGAAVILGKHPNTVRSRMKKAGVVRKVTGG